MECAELSGLVIVQRLPEANPDIEQAEAAANAAKETVIHHAAERRERHQEIIVSPSGSPGQNDEQYTGDRANQHKKEDGDAMQP